METDTPKKINDLIWNVLSIAVMVAMVIVGIIFVVLFLNPGSAINPFPPEEFRAEVVIPTVIPTYPATWTPTTPPTSTVAPTDVPPTQEVPVVSATPEEIKTVIPTATQKPGGHGYTFAVQTDPSPISSIYYRPEWGCDWLGLAGNTVDLQNSPVTGIRVQVGGFLSGNKVDLLSLTGTALQYGRAGYEFTLAEKPAVSTGKLWIQLLDQSDLPLSDKIYFDTFDTCDKNLIIINFKQVR